MDGEKGSEIATFRLHCSLSDFNNFNLFFLFIFQVFLSLPNYRLESHSKLIEERRHFHLNISERLETSLSGPLA
jgi:hypothetical protein